MAVSEAQKKASNKYNKEHMATLGCKVTKEQAQAFKNHCKSRGSTTNKVLRDFVLDSIEPEALNGSAEPAAPDETAPEEQADKKGVYTL